MLKIDKKNDKIVVVFDPINEIMGAVVFAICFFIVLNIGLYLAQKQPTPLNTLKFSFFGILPLLIASLILWKKIEINFNKKKLEVYKNFYGIRKLKVSLEYFKIQNMEKYYIGGKGGSYELIIKETSNTDYSIVRTSLKEELDEIIKIYKNDVKEMLVRIKIKDELDEKIQKSTEIYNLSLKERYQEILKKIIEEEKLYISKIEERTIINGDSTAIQNLEVFKNMKWEEVNFYTFYVNYLSKKEKVDEYVEVAYNGTDSKKVKVSELKEDINKIRYPQDYEN